MSPILLKFAPKRQNLSKNKLKKKLPTPYNTGAPPCIGAPRPLYNTRPGPLYKGPQALI